MEKLLALRESQIWDFPKFPELDDSIVKYDTMSIYEDHHGMGTLEHADRFNFTTKNEDKWLLPSESYLLVQCRLSKNNGDPYIWEAVAGQVAQQGPPVVPAVPAQVPENASIDDSGFNLFEEAKYYIDDKKVESIDYLGISTLVDNLLTYTDETKEKSIKHSQLWFRDNASRMAYVRACEGTVNLLLPLNRIFTFCKHVNHVFRGVKHRIEFTLNDSARTVLRNAGVDPGKVQIMKMEWVMPYVEPSLLMMAKLESQLATNSTFKMTWPAINVFTEQPPQNQKIRLDLNATVHKPTKVFILTQNLTRTTAQTENTLRFDHLDLRECFVEVNGVKFPERPIETNFVTRDIQEAYQNFLKVCDGQQSCISLEAFRDAYPLMCIDVSQHKPELYASTQFPNIVINLEFANPPPNPYVLWVVVYNEREAELSLDQKKMRVIP